MLSAKHEHTPLPWRIAGKGTIRGAGKDCWVGTLHWRDREANAAFIIKAVNSHDELKASLIEMVEIYWGDGDGYEPAPVCVQRAMAVLASIKETA